MQVIDLDAARGEGSNREIVAGICRQLPCQIGGGIRSPREAEAAVDGGARRVIIGSALFDGDGVNPQAASAFEAAVGLDALVAAVDGRSGKVAVAGWQRTLELSVTNAMAALEPFAGTFLATLIDGEGLMHGIDITAARALRMATRRRLIVAGGIKGRDEVDELDRQGIDAVVGMAIYTGAFALDEVAR